MKSRFLSRFTLPLVFAAATLSMAPLHAQDLPGGDTPMPAQPGDPAPGQPAPGQPAPGPEPAPPGTPPGAPGAPGSPDAGAPGEGNSAAAAPVQVPTVVSPTTQEGRESIVRVTVTTQPWEIRQPWLKSTPRSGTAIGAVLEGGRVLVTGDLVANSSYIEMEDLATGEKTPARVEVVDYEANLAIVKPNDPEFLKDSVPLELATDAKLGDDLDVWQVQPTGDITPAHGKITSVELLPYSMGNYFLAYRLNLSLQYRYANLSLPIVRDGKLVGLLMRYNGEQQTLDVAAAPIIEHFLKEAAKPNYSGFPLSGIEIVPMQDPQLRRYIGLPADQEGVYIQNVVSNRSAANAGLKAGDVILSIAGQDIDNRGNYDHPIFGRISLAHLIRAEHYVGDTAKFTIWRDGKRQEIDVKMEHRPAQDFLVPPYLVDQQPRFLIVGGLVLQELSLPYLQEYGATWTTSAPQNLMYYWENQENLPDENRDKIVFITGMVPTNFTIGYEGLSNAVISKVNGQEIGSLEAVEKALKKPVDGFHKIELEQDPKVIYLDPSDLPKIDRTLTEMYGLPALKNLGAPAPVEA